MLDVSLPAILTTIVVFLFLIYFLNVKLYKPLLAHMEKREAIIAEDEENARKNALDADSNKAEIIKVLDAAKAQAAKIKQDAIESAKESAGKEIAEKRAVIEDDFAKFMDGLDEQKEGLKSDLRSKIPEFKSDIQAAVARI